MLCFYFFRGVNEIAPCGRASTPQGHLWTIYEKDPCAFCHQAGNPRIAYGLSPRRNGIQTELSLAEAPSMKMEGFSWDESKEIEWRKEQKEKYLRIEPWRLPQPLGAEFIRGEENLTCNENYFVSAIVRLPYISSARYRCSDFSADRQSSVCCGFRASRTME
jgi:hypothetical protein